MQRGKPVRVQQVFNNVLIEKLSRQDEGITHIEHLVIFVKGGEPGQRCKIIITKVGPSYAEAELVEGA